MPLKKRNKVNAEFSMSSLTDIIFLLLIFFMLTSTFVTQNALNLQLPSSSSKTVAPQSLAVSVDKQGQYYLNGNQMSLSAIEADIRNRKRTASGEEKLTLTILSDRGTAVQYVVDVMGMANRLNINAILATEAPR